MSTVNHVSHLNLATDGDTDMNPSNREMENTRDRTVAAAQLPSLPPTPRGFQNSPLSLTAVSTPEHTEVSVFFNGRQMDASSSPQQAIVFTIPSPLEATVFGSPRYTPQKRKFIY